MFHEVPPIRKLIGVLGSALDTGQYLVRGEKILRESSLLRERSRSRLARGRELHHEDSFLFTSVPNASFSERCFFGKILCSVPDETGMKDRKDDEGRVEDDNGFK
jgi:hypothetical protein